MNKSDLDILLYSSNELKKLLSFIDKFEDGEYKDFLNSRILDHKKTIRKYKLKRLIDDIT